MRLIDADKLLEDIANGIKAGNYVEGYEEFSHINNVDDCVECVEYADVVLSLPDKPTNGDMIKAMFGEPADKTKSGVLYKFKYKNGKPMFSTFFDLTWWNAPWNRLEKK